LEAVWSLRLYAGSEASSLLSFAAPHSSLPAVCSWRTPIEVPFVTRPEPTLAQLVGKACPNFWHHRRLVSEVTHPPAPHQLFDIPVTEAEAKVEPHSGTNALGRKRWRRDKMSGVFMGWVPSHLSLFVNTWLS